MSENITDIKSIISNEDINKDKVWWRCVECGIFIYSEVFLILYIETFR